MHCLTPGLAVIFIFLLTDTAVAQMAAPIDTTKNIIPRDTNIITKDSSIINIDSLKKPEGVVDTNAVRKMEDSLGIRISDDALPSPVTSEATDSAVMKVSKNVFSLYGNAKVSYENMKLAASQIVYRQDANIVTATFADDTSTVREKNTFSQGTENFTYDSLQYNFKSKKAIVKNARSQHGEGFVFSKQVKRNPDQSIYGYRNVYTTCALDTPHFGIFARKIKVIPDRVIASGGAHLEIEGVPTPLFLPFGIFPISETQRSGFKLPTYTVEANRGLGLVNGGYYFYINDYVDLLTQANIFSKGSWSASALSTYSNRYHYNGALSVSYAYNKMGESYEPGSQITKDFRIGWHHATDGKARPGVNFNASVDAGTQSYYSNNSYNVNQILQNNYLSNITFQKNWQDKPLSLTISTTYNQNTTNKQTTLALPNINFYVSQFNPLRARNSVGNRWFDKITMGYSLNGVNQTTFYDSGFSLRTLSFDQFQTGVHHTIPIAASYTVFRFVNLSFSSTYNEYWLTKQRYQYFNNSEYTLDTVSYNGFFTSRDISASMSMSTRIYGMKMFKNKKLMGIRHVLTPSVGFGYIPDYARAPFSYYYQTRLGPEGTPVYLSPYDGSPVGVPGLGQYGDFSSSITYGLNNNLQIKLRNSKDTATGSKNVTLIDGLSIGGSYNVAADSFNWSPVSASFRTSILNTVNVSAGASFDPYSIDYETGRRTPMTNYDAGRGLLRLTSANASLGSAFRSKQKSGNESKGEKTDEFTRMMKNGGYNDYIDFNVPWSLNVAYSLNLSKGYTYYSKRDTVTYSQNLLLSGDFNLTPKWKVTFSTGYDFTYKRLSLSSFDIYRDLHCWEMRMGVIPFGERKSYNFTLNVKATVLQDLRLLRRRDYRDAVN